LKKGFKLKIFISWSGNRSKAVAELMNDWLKCVIQASEPWISSKDIDRGALWFSEINDKLRDVSIGVICLTQENKNKPWILFETGALAKGLTTNRVCTFLIDLQPEDLQDPLGQFNHTLPEKSSIWSLICTINDCLDENALDRKILEQVFETYWPQFEDGFALALKANLPQEDVPPRSNDDMLSEILNQTRSISKRVNILESGPQFEPKRVNFLERTKSWKEVNDFSGIKNRIKEVRELLSNGSLTTDEAYDHLISLGLHSASARRVVEDNSLEELSEITGIST
jgi:hypothetical protein